MNRTSFGSAPSPNGSPKDPSMLEVLPKASMSRSEATISTCPAITRRPAHPFRRTSPAATKASTANIPSFATELATNGNSVSSWRMPWSR
jgi:hypothetical protein